jgi:hypothetical protein
MFVEIRGAPEITILGIDTHILRNDTQLPL